jgi:hypothetical protein
MRDLLEILLATLTNWVLLFWLLPRISYPNGWEKNWLYRRRCIAHTMYHVHRLNIETNLKRRKNRDASVWTTETGPQYWGWLRWQRIRCAACWLALLSAIYRSR